MKRCILVPDSFKGTMSSITVSEIMEQCIKEYFPKCNVIAIPVADGGEGTVDCFLQAMGGEKIKTYVKGPFFEDIESFYGISGSVAIIEMAAAAGLPLALGKLDPVQATTYGVGQLVCDAIKRGCNKIVVGLGGSCTNDGGSGMAVALGTKFFNKSMEEFIPTGGTLAEVESIDLSGTKELLSGVEVIAMCDINNPMFGETGAAYVFAPQKGADDKTVAFLDEQLRAFAKTIKRCTGLDVAQKKGSGAAGAMGAGVYAFLGGQLKQGIDTVLDLVGFDEMLSGCDCVFTGEGRLDRQSLSGKVVVGVGKRAKNKNIPVIAVVGVSDIECCDISKEGVTEVYEINRDRTSFQDILENCHDDLRTTMREILLSKKEKRNNEKVDF